MNSRNTLALVGIVSATSASGCYSTWDLTPRGVTALNGFRSENIISVETNENERITFTKDTKLTFYGKDGAVAEMKFNRIDIQRNILTGEESDYGERLHVDLSRMNSVQATNFSVAKTTLVAMGTAVPIIIWGYFLVALANATSAGGGR